MFVIAKVERAYLAGVLFVEELEGFGFGIECSDEDRQFVVVEMVAISSNNSIRMLGSTPLKARRPP